MLCQYETSQIALQARVKCPRMHTSSLCLLSRTTAGEGAPQVPGSSLQILYFYTPKHEPSPSCRKLSAKMSATLQNQKASPNTNHHLGASAEGLRWLPHVAREPKLSRQGCWWALRQHMGSPSPLSASELLSRSRGQQLQCSLSSHSWRDHRAPGPDPVGEAEIPTSGGEGACRDFPVCFWNADAGYLGVSVCVWWEACTRTEGTAAWVCGVCELSLSVVSYSCQSSK